MRPAYLVRLVAALLIHSFLGCSTRSSPVADVVSDSSVRDISSLIRIPVGEGRSPRGVALFLHGLNTGPQSLRLFAQTLADRDIESFILPLDGGECGARGVSADGWISQVRRAQQLLREHYPGLPQHLIGFSLGGSLAVAALDAEAEERPDTLTLLSPALALQCYTHSVRLLTWLKVFGISLPSLAPRDLRACSFTSFAAYDGLFKVYSRTQSLHHSERLSEISTLLVVRDGDELIHRKGLQRWLQTNELERWRYKELHTADPSCTPRHAMFGPETVGEEGWKELVSIVASHLGMSD